MRVSARPLRSVLAAALALAAVPALAQSPYSKTVFFGDSLTDTGYYRPILAQLNPSASIIGRNRQPGLGVVQIRGRTHYGTDATPNGNGQKGDNYAVGGARVGVDAVGGGWPDAVDEDPTRQLPGCQWRQSQTGDNALYSVWGGANDLFAVAAGAPVQATIGAAVAYPGGNGRHAEGGWRAAIPDGAAVDIGLTPSSRAGGAAAMAQGTALAKAYNDALFARLEAGRFAGDSSRYLHHPPGNRRQPRYRRFHQRQRHRLPTAGHRAVDYLLPIELRHPECAQYLRVCRWRAPEHRRA